MAEQHWRVQDSSYRMPRDHKPVVLYYDPTPGGRKNDDGTTTISLNFPALAITEWVNQPDEIGRQLAAELNAHEPMVQALDDLKMHAIEDGANMVIPKCEWDAAFARLGDDDVGGARE